MFSSSAMVNNRVSFVGLKQNFCRNNSMTILVLEKVDDSGNLLSAITASVNLKPRTEPQLTTSERLPILPVTYHTN